MQVEGHVRTVTVSEAKANLSRLLQLVLDGEDIAIGRRGQPEVVLRRYREADAPRRPLGEYDGPFWMANDFDEPDERIEAMFGGEE